MGLIPYMLFWYWWNLSQLLFKLSLLFFVKAKKISILESATLHAQPITLMLFIRLTFPVHTDFYFTTFCAVKLLEEGTGGRTSESVGPFKLADSATSRPARPQAHSPVSTAQQIRAAPSAGEADSVKPSWTALNLLTSLLGDGAAFSRSVSEAHFGSTFPDTSSSLTLPSSLEVSRRLYCTGSIPWHSVSLTHLPFHYRVWKQLQLSEVCCYFEALR